MPLYEGHTLQNGRFTVIRKLGEGGMGNVYLVKDQSLDWQYAIKAISENVLHKAGLRQFQSEAQLLARLDHPNLPKVQDFFIEQDRPYIRMDYVEGQTLRSLCADRTSPPKVGVILEWTTDLLSALRYLHEHKPPIIHRDVKPSNVCITRDGKAVLLDLGIARRLDDTNTRTGARAHSPNYSPIEQYLVEAKSSYDILQHYLEELKAADIHTGPYSDVYSLGATLYFALTSLGPPDPRFRIFEEALRPVYDFNPHAPTLLVDTIAIAMRVDPRERFQSAHEMAAHLQPLLDGETAAVSQVTRRIVQPYRPRHLMVEDKPADIVRRPAEFEALKAHLLDEAANEAVVAAAALRGAGGYGKTTLAQDLCYDPEIWQAFPDGILWVTIGEKPNLYDSLCTLYAELTDQHPAFANEQDAANHLAQAWGDQRCLLVIDDVWHEADLRPFLRGGPCCVRLVTTRNRDTLPRNARQVDVDAMQSDEAVALLGTGLPDEVRTAHAAPFRQLAARLGEWPLLLKLANGVLLNRLRCGQTLSEALTYLNRALDKRGVTAFDARDAHGREQAVASTLSVSFDLLREDEYARYSELAIFPKDMDIPLSTVEKLWSVTGGLDDFDTEALCLLLDRLSLLLNLDLHDRALRLHDVIHDYLASQLSDHLPALHTQLLDAHRPAVTSPLLPDTSTSTFTWADLSPDEPYLWDTLAYHLVGAERGDELVTTVMDLRYLAVKTYVRNAYAAELDLLEAERQGHGDTTLRLLRGSFVQGGHLLNRCEKPRDLITTLYSRLQHLKELAPLVEGLKRVMPLPHLVPRHPLPDLPHPALRRSLVGHSKRVGGCAISGDGSTAISTSSGDNTIRVWDVQSGKELLMLPRTPGALNRCCAINDDGSIVVFAPDLETFKVWDIRQRRELLTLSDQGPTATDCAISADGKVIVTASGFGGLGVWDTYTGEMLLDFPPPYLTGVSACTVTPKGTVIIAGLGNGDLVLLNTQQKAVQQIATDCKDPVNGCAVSADGMIIAFTALDDQVLRIVDRRRKRMLNLVGHKDTLTGCSVSEDGRVVVSASHDKTLKIWDVKAANERMTLYGHTGDVNGCAISADGTVVVSVSTDTTVKVWDITSKTASQPLSAEYTGTLLSCAITRDGVFAVSGGEEANLSGWNAQQGKKRWTLMGHDYDSVVWDCDISRDGETIISGGLDKKLIVWRARKRKKRWILKHGALIMGCALDDGGNVAVSASADKTLKVWDTSSGKELHALSEHEGVIWSCAISGDGSLIVSASADETLKVWNAISGTAHLTLIGHTDQVADCAISADMSTILSASFDHTLKVWDAKSGEARTTLRGHTDQVLGCAMSCDGSTFVSVSSDRSIKVWDTQSGDCVATLHTESLLYACACSDDGQYIVAVGEGGIYFLQFVR